MLSKILIANRGEIAVRIMRACKEMGIATVAVFSEADKDSLHVSLADESYCIGPAKVSDSYLNMGAVITAAVNSGAEAIHPGYGLLAENAAFARLCEACSITFIGPDSDTIEKLGNKQQAIMSMSAAGVPVIPGSGVIKDSESALATAKKVGYPLLIKAVAGGGGKGIRLVNAPEQLGGALLAAQAESKSAFSCGDVYFEKFLRDIKHVEVQLLCDNYGNVAALGERDCSVQRGNQKILEESPCITLDPQVRRRLYDVSVKAAKQLNYRGAGTMEYLLTDDGNFYFMEMNTRLQVEHPVTEMVTGIDLVKWQIRIAAGLALESVPMLPALNGHAIECRINAENPYENFRPACGQITLLHIPGGPWVRFDTALYQGCSISPFYDSMIGKLIVHAKTRDEAIRKMQAALCELAIEGVDTNTELHTKILSHPEFEKGSYTTAFLPKVLGTGKTAD